MAYGGPQSLLPQKSGNSPKIPGKSENMKHENPKSKNPKSAIVQLCNRAIAITHKMYTPNSEKLK